jgi:hypothetical protein
MSSTAQIFPVVGSNFNLPVPLPTKDAADGTPGTTAPTTAIQVAGTDGTNLRAILTDTLGRMEAVGAAANGAVVSGNPVYVAGFDGTYLQALYTDTKGQLRVLVENSVTVGNSVTVLQGTNPWVMSGSVAVNRVAQLPSAPTQATVGAASGLALASNSSRTGLVLVNTSGNTISIAFGANAAVLNSGITLNPNGGTFVMDAFTFTTQAVNAIAGAASSNLAIQELA